MKNVVFLENVNKNKFTPSVFTIDSKPIFAFQISAENYFIGYVDEIKKFLKAYSTENEILKREIDDFMKCG